MTSQYEQWRKLVNSVELRLAEVETQLNQSRGDPVATAVRFFFTLHFSSVWAFDDVLGHFTCDSRVLGLNPGGAVLSGSNLGQVVHTQSPSRLSGYSSGIPDCSVGDGCKFVTKLL